jgi:hypothetical protein
MRLGEHFEEHLFQNPYGEYFIWEDDFTCDCCIPEEEGRCFVYGEISEEDAKALTTKRD